ncbi:MAG: protein kinase domain-containing protein [Thermomicrobiales bacterium]
MQVSDQQRIGERYDLRQTIGIGGMARVYLAHDRRLHRDVAAKILNPALASDPLFVERFRREAQAAAALNHPNIVAIYDTGTTDDSYFIVMEYVPGPNLKEAIRERGALPEAEALGIGAQVAAALEAAHSSRLIHRDIKPHNVLLHPEGVAKVTDFGIARAAGASQLTSTQMVMGTAHYLSPEQALHRPLDGRSDLYSLGIVLYEALTGQVPFNGDSLVAVAMMQVHETPQPIRALRPEIAPETEAVVMKALAKDPAQRYQSAAEMRAALLRARDGLRPPAIAETRPLAANPPTVTIERTAAYDVPPGTPIDPPPPMPRDEIPPERPERRRGGFIAPLLIAAICVLAIGVGLFVYSRSHGGNPATAATTTASRPTVNTQATALTVPTATAPPTVAPTAPPRPTTVPTAVANVAPTAAPLATPTVAPTVAPTIPPPSPTPLAPPTATPAPVPTATIAPPTAPPATAAPAVIANGASTPAGAVQQFYQLVSSRQFDAAANLWSDRMKAQFPPDGNINGHFGQDQRVDVAVGNTQNTGDGRATVAVEVTEVRASGTIRATGTWLLVRGPSGWLLDQPNLQAG